MERSVPPSFAEYERLKRDWLRDHPDCSPAEYEAAMRKIARRCGV
jgi:hypothetical protein